MLRIIGGNLRGKKFETLPGNHVRPTLGRVREAVFSSLRSRIDFSLFTFIDLFSGSGSMAFEAYSQGFQNVIAIELDKKVNSLLKVNQSSLKISNEKFSHNQSDAVQWLKKKFPPNENLVFFADPPYQSNLYCEIVNEISAQISPVQQIVLILEKDKSEKFIPELSEDSLIFNKSYATSEILMYSLSL